MDTCAGCGRPLPAVGRFCTNCGLRRGASPAAPSGAEPERVRPPRHRAQHEPAEDAPPPPPDVPGTWVPWDSLEPGPDARPQTALPVVGVVLAIVLVAAVGSLLLFRANDGPAPSSAGSTASPALPSASGQGSDDAPAAPKDQRTQLRARAEVNVPRTAEPSTQTDGSQVTFDGSNMVDGDPHTTWRMDGDGSGSTLTFSFPGPVVLTRVGLVNGYAKTDGGVDWYHGNRRLTEVEWLFDDGTSRTQKLGDTTRMQAIRLRPVRTRMVQLRLVGVTAPGPGYYSRDYTAISGVTLVGVPEYQSAAS